jgi:hypothetical protein
LFSKLSENNKVLVVVVLVVVASEAEQAVLDVLVPPPEPLQLQVHGPEPANVATVPAEQRLGLADVREVNDCPFAEPQAPFTGVMVGGGVVVPPLALPPIRPIKALPLASLFGGVML